MSRKQMDQDVDGVPIFNVINNSHVTDWKNISNTNNFDHWGRHGHDRGRMVVGFTTTYAISADHH
jgi:hypothetical protein